MEVSTSKLARRLRPPARNRLRSAIGAAKRLVPRNALGIWGFIGAGMLITHLPMPVVRGLTRAAPSVVRLHDAVHVRDYPSELLRGTS